MFVPCTQHFYNCLCIELNFINIINNYYNTIVTTIDTLKNKILGQKNIYNNCLSRSVKSCVQLKEAFFSKYIHNMEHNKHISVQINKIRKANI